MSTSAIKTETSWRREEYEPPAEAKATGAPAAPPPDQDGVDPVGVDRRDDLFGGQPPAASPSYTQEQARADAETLHRAIDGPGTKEDLIWKTLEGKSKEQLDMIRAAYREKYGGDMDKDLRGDFGTIFEKGERKKLDGLLGGSAPITPETRAEKDFASGGRPGDHLVNLNAHKDDPTYLARYVELLKEKGELDGLVKMVFVRTSGRSVDPTTRTGRT
jgi:hypothetical protein